MGAALPRSYRLLALAALLMATPLAHSGCQRVEPPPPAKVSPRPSKGCRAGAVQPGGRFLREQLQLGARTRTYHLRLPDDYRSDRPYPLVFRFHGYSGDGLSGGLAIERVAGRDAIVVGPDGLDKNWTRASEAEDLHFFDAMHEDIGERYCVDLARVHAYGFSAGAGFANLLSCSRGDKLRGVAVIAGFARGGERCRGELAGWYQHDRADPRVPLSEGKRARDRMLARNGCAARTRAQGDCVRYEGCRAPVMWCETDGLGSGHDIDGERAPERVWAFLRNL